MARTAVLKFVVMVIIIGIIDQAAGYCEVYNKLPSTVVKPCQDNSVTGSQIYLDSDGSPADQRVSCECSITRTEGTDPHVIFVATIWNKLPGVEVELDGFVLDQSNPDQPGYNITSGSQLIFRKKTISNEPKLCYGFSVGGDLANITLACSSRYTFLPSPTTTLRPPTTTAAPVTTTAAPVTTTVAPVTSAVPITTTAAPFTTAAPVTTAVPVTTAAPVTTTAAPVTTTAVPATTAKSTTTRRPTTQPPVSPSSQAPILPTAETAGGEDNYASRQKTTDIVIFVALGLAILVMLIVAITACVSRRNEPPKQDNKEMYRVYGQPREEDYYMTTNPGYVSSDDYLIRSSPNDAEIITDYGPPPEEYRSQDLRHVQCDSAEYTLVNVRGTAAKEPGYHVVSLVVPDNNPLPETNSVVMGSFGYSEPERLVPDVYYNTDVSEEGAQYDGIDADTIVVRYEGDVGEFKKPEPEEETGEINKPDPEVESQRTYSPSVSEGGQQEDDIGTEIGPRIETEVHY